MPATLSQSGAREPIGPESPGRRRTGLRRRETTLPARRPSPKASADSAQTLRNRYNPLRRDAPGPERRGEEKDSKNPRRHGPYHKVSYVYRGRSTSRFVSRDQVKEIQAELANYKHFRKLTDEWVGLALKLAKEKRKPAA